ncbi:hypothetical protein RI844_04900 [Thalassotalea fonticola]|uniref:Uncharacterized protein n=1 Tax=Thalassotalea fonticola TaxID=3065649 RepID=A0ABZ0GT09_9GAMM|nr:hypothetical protein RI844_04900 [Colwelliaceae bacterium S1-1]
MEKITALFLLLTLTACGGESSTDTKEQVQPKETPEMVIGEGKFNESKLG